MNTTRTTALATLSAGAVVAALVLTASLAQAGMSATARAVATSVAYQVPRVLVADQQRIALTRCAELPRVVVIGQVERQHTVVTEAPNHGAARF